MRLLVDTHVLVWIAAAPERLPAPVRERIESLDNEVLFSAASIWELAIKHQMGRVALDMVPGALAEEAVRRGFEELAVTSAHAAGVGRLPLHHRDPFDRLLLAQAVHEPARLLTADRTLARYGPLVEVIG